LWTNGNDWQWEVLLFTFDSDCPKNSLKFLLDIRVISYLADLGIWSSATKYFDRVVCNWLYNSTGLSATLGGSRKEWRLSSFFSSLNFKRYDSLFFSSKNTYNESDFESITFSELENL
jgi:hypothetical protein